MFNKMPDTKGQKHDFTNTRYLEQSNLQKQAVEEWVWGGRREITGHYSMRSLVWGNEKVLKMDSGDECLTT